MDNAVAMRFVERVGDVDADANYLLGGQRAILEPLLERFSLEQLHHDGVVADVVERADVRVAQRRDGFRLPLEARVPLGLRCEFGQQDLYRDAAI